jgi:hypothetical protein
MITLGAPADHQGRSEIKMANSKNLIRKKFENRSYIQFEIF